jgi:hypothetical protein
MLAVAMIVFVIRGVRYQKKNRASGAAVLALFLSRSRQAMSKLLDSLVKQNCSIWRAQTYVHKRNCSECKDLRADFLAFGEAVKERAAEQAKNNLIGAGQPEAGEKVDRYLRSINLEEI